MMATRGRGMAGDRRRGQRQAAADMGGERADIAPLDVVTGEVLDFGDCAFDSAHANGSGPSMLVNDEERLEAPAAITGGARADVKAAALFQPAARGDGPDAFDLSRGGCRRSPHADVLLYRNSRR